MRYIYIALVTISAFLVLSSCDKDVQLPVKDARSKHLPTSITSRPEVVDFRGEQTLRFKDKRSLQAYLQDDIESESFSIRESFFSQYLAIDSLLKSSIEASGVSFLEHDFTRVKKASAFYALFNDAEIEGAHDPYPICRAKSRAEAMVANKSGIYLVGDSICEISLYPTYGAAIGKNGGYNILALYPTTKQEFRTNNAFGHTSNRKCRAVIGVDPNSRRVHLTVTAQKKVGFLAKWWIRYATTYLGRLTITGLGQPLIFDSNSSFGYRRLLVEGGATTMELSGGGYQLSPGYTRHIIEFSIEEETGDASFTFARFSPIEDPEHDLHGQPCFIQGALEFCSRGVPYENKGWDNVDLSFPIS